MGIKKFVLIGLLSLFLFGCTEQKQFLFVDSDQNLNDLNDVEISNPTNAQALIYQSSTGLWKNLAQTGAGGGGRTYSGQSPVSVDNDQNVIALNVLPTSDWNGIFDGQQGSYYLNWANDNNRLFSLLTLDNNNSFDARYNKTVDSNNSGRLNFQVIANPPWRTEPDTNIFSSGVADCNSASFVFGFNSNGTIDCRTDLTGGSGGSSYQAGGNIVLVTTDNNAFHFNDGNYQSFSHNFSKDQNFLKINTTDINSGSGNIFVNSTKYSINNDLNRNAITLCDGNTALNGDGVCVNLTNFHVDNDTTYSAGGGLVLIGNTFYFNDGNFLSAFHIWSFAQRYNADINNFIARSNLFDLNVGGTGIRNNSVVYAFSDLNRSAVANCGSDSNSVLNSRGQCVSITGFDIDTTGSGGGGFDQNIYSIGIMSSDNNHFLIDANFEQDVNVGANFKVDLNASIDGNVIIAKRLRVDQNTNFGSDVIVNQGKRFCYDPNCVHYSLFDGSKRIDT